jgi:hypothetical protein
MLERNSFRFVRRNDAAGTSALFTVLVTALHSHPIRHDSQSRSKKRARYEIHPHIGQQIFSHFSCLPCFSHTQGNPVFRISSVLCVSFPATLHSPALPSLIIAGSSNGALPVECARFRHSFTTCPQFRTQRGWITAWLQSIELTRLTNSLC